MSNNEGVSMERLSIDEVIAHCNRQIRDYERLNGKTELENADISLNFIKQYWEHRQVAEWLRELKTYKDAEKKGLLPKFYLGYEFWIEWLGEILKAKIVMLQQKKDGTWKYRFCDERSHTMDYEENELGKYFFATKEEAEQALAEMKEV